MGNNVRVILVMVCGALLAGCARAYVEPSGGPMAKLRVISREHGISTPVMTTAKHGCYDGWEGTEIGTLGAADRFTNTKVGVPSETEDKPNQKLEVVISAEQPFSIQGGATYITGVVPFPPFWLWGQCKSSITFVPKADEFYEAVFESSSLKDCKVSLVQFKRDGDVWKRVPVEDAKYAVTPCS